MLSSLISLFMWDILHVAGLDQKTTDLGLHEDTWPEATAYSTGGFVLWNPTRSTTEALTDRVLCDNTCRYRHQYSQQDGSVVHSVQKREPRRTTTQSKEYAPVIIATVLINCIPKIPQGSNYFDCSITVMTSWGFSCSLSCLKKEKKIDNSDFVRFILATF